MPLPANLPEVGTATRRPHSRQVKRFWIGCPQRQLGGVGALADQPNLNLKACIWAKCPQAPHVAGADQRADAMGMIASKAHGMRPALVVQPDINQGHDDYAYNGNWPDGAQMPRAIRPSFNSQLALAD